MTTRQDLEAPRAALIRRIGSLQSRVTFGDRTVEFHMLNALRGLVLRTDGSTVVCNWYAEFGITPAVEIDFDLDNATPGKGALRKTCYDVITSGEGDVGGLVPGTLTIEAVCGRGFYRDLTSHREVIDAYHAAMKINELSGKPADVFDWAASAGAATAAGPVSASISTSATSSRSASTGCWSNTPARPRTSRR